MSLNVLSYDPVVDGKSLEVVSPVIRALPNESNAAALEVPGPDCPSLATPPKKVL